LVFFAFNATPFIFLLDIKIVLFYFIFFDQISDIPMIFPNTLPTPENCLLSNAPIRRLIS